MDTDSSKYEDIDRIDRAILGELQRDGRISNAELAARVGIAESTCHKRMRVLMSSGAIRGFRAEIDPEALGLHLEALPATRRVYFLGGERDFLVHVAVRDAQALRELVADTISVREEVAATTTNLIFDHAPRRHEERRDLSGR